MPVHRSTMRWMATLAAATSLVLVASAGNVLAQADPTVTYGQQITDFGFDPIQLSVNAGDTVTWTNAGTMPHAVTADDDSFDSGLINPGDTIDMSFSTPGSYPYHCTAHPWMKGVITVGGGGNSGL